MLNGFGTIVNSLGKRVKPYLPQICGTILWRLNNKSAKVRQQAADLISRIAVVMKTCQVIYFYIPTSVGTLLENTRLEKTRRFLDGRVLARNYSKRKITNSTRSHSKVEFRVMPGYTRVFLSTFRSSISYVHL